MTSCNGPLAPWLLIAIKCLVKNVPACLRGCSTHIHARLFNLINVCELACLLAGWLAGWFASLFICFVCVSVSLFVVCVSQDDGAGRLDLSKKLRRGSYGV